MLGQIQGYLLAAGLQTWQGLQACACKPYAIAGMHRHATMSYRRFAVCLLSNALQVSFSSFVTPLKPLLDHLLTLLY